jgi:hypothetical protein
VGFDPSGKVFSMKLWAIPVLAFSICVSNSYAVALAADAPATPPSTAQPAPAAQQPGASPLQQGGTSVSVHTETEAEKWVDHRNEPLWQQQAEEQKAKKKPIKNFIKAIKGNYKEEMSDMGKDMALLFSVGDKDPYDINKPPIDKPVIMMAINFIDGSTGYLWRFTDDSFAIEGSYLDNTVIVPIKNENNEFIIKYPNGVTGRVVKQGQTTTIYRPDHTTTTLQKRASGDYTINNSKLGYMGEAHGDPSGVNYELGTWTQAEHDTF